MMSDSRCEDFENDLAVPLGEGLERKIGGTTAHLVNEGGENFNSTSLVQCGCSQKLTPKEKAKTGLSSSGLSTNAAKSMFFQERPRSTPGWKSRSDS